MNETISVGKSENGDVRLDVARLIKTRLLVTANSGGGKSWLLRKLFEGLGQSTQLIVLDREGEFVTLREKLDVVLVGPQGEIPTDLRSAGLLIRRLMEKHLSAVVDMSELTLQHQRRYVRLFLEAMVGLPKELWGPCFVGLDETHLFAPEKGAGEAESLEAVVNLITLGRKRGYAAICATQRISKFSKDAAAELLNKFIGRTTLDVDRIRAADELGISRDEGRALRDLSPVGNEGEFYSFGPAMLEPGVTKLRVGKVVTTHPEAGQGRTIEPPKPSRAISAVLSELTDLPKQAEAEIRDMTAAKSRIAQLERELTKKPAPPAPETRIIEKPVVTDAQVKTVEKVAATLEREGNRRVKMAEDLAASGRELVAQAKEFTAALSKAAGANSPPVRRPVVVARPVATARPVAQRQIESPESSGDLGKCERSILCVLSQFPEGCKKEKLTLLTGYRYSGGFRNSLGALRTQGLIDGDNEETMTITEDGLNKGPFDPLPQGQAFVNYWLTHRSLGKCERSILQELINNPSGMAADDLCRETGYEYSGGFRNSLGALRTAGLLTGKNNEIMQASPELLEAAASPVTK